MAILIPTPSEYATMVTYVPFAAAQRPRGVIALFDRYLEFRTWVRNWWTLGYAGAVKMVQAIPGETAAPAPTPAPTPTPDPAPGAGTPGTAPPGQGTTQNPIQAGGVSWGGKFYTKPYDLRVALGFGAPTPAARGQWQQWLGLHPAIQAWVNSYTAAQPPAQPPAPGGGGQAPGEPGGGMPPPPGTTSPPGGEVPPPVPPPETGVGVTPPGATGPTDYSGLLGIAGLPADVAAQVTALFRSTADPNQAAALALAYVRGTPWYATTFVGINEGIKAGLFTDERGYRSYRNALDQTYRQWTSGALTQEALHAALGEGVSPDVVDRRFQGRAYADANRQELQLVSGAFGENVYDAQGNLTRQSRLTEPEVQAYGQQKAGLGTPGGTGMLIERQLGQAFQRMQRAFEGVAASPQLGLTSRGTLFAPGLAPGSVKPDIAA